MNLSSVKMNSLKYTFKAGPLRFILRGSIVYGPSPHTTGVGLPVNIALDVPEFISSLTWEGRGSWFKLANSIKLSRKNLKQMFFTELAALPPPAHMLQPKATSRPAPTQEESVFEMTEQMLGSIASEFRHWKSIWTWIPEWARIMQLDSVYKASSDGYK
jgi:hypothetical protein